MEDLDFILKTYLHETGDQRVFEEAPELLAKGLLRIDDACCVLAGARLGTLFHQG